MLQSFFNPKSIAVIGASAEKTKLGYTILKNIIKFNYKGRVYPVNLKSKKNFGLQVYPSVKDIPEVVDIALFVIPSQFVLAALAECGEKGIKNAIIISAGFKEVGGEGKVLEEKLVEISKKYNINILGPNCLGFLDSTINLNASFSEGMILPGKVAFMSQSGAICTAMLDWALASRLGFSRFISLGNKSGINENDLLEFLMNDDKTKVVLAYLEGFADGAKFLQIARKLTIKKPLIIIKSGRTAAGQAAISSHTGSLAGAEEAVNAALKQTNTLRAETLEELFDLVEMFSNYDTIRNNKIAVVANAGGPGVMTTDAVTESCMELAQLQKSTTLKLKKELPVTANIHNPIDVIGDARADRYETALKAVIQDENVGSVIVILTPQSVTEIDKTAEVIIKYRNKEKPIIASFIGGVKVASGIDILEKNKIPHYSFPNIAVDTLAKFYLYSQNKKSTEKFIKFSVSDSAKKQIADIFRNKATNGSIDFLDCEKILRAYNIPVIKSALAKSSEEAGKMADKLGYPIAMKVISADIIHKTDAGGVKIKLADKAAVVKAFNDIMKSCRAYNKSAKIDGILLQPMVKDGKEIIFGIKRDPQFGPLLMFGLGGVYVEVLKDVAFRLAPLSYEQATKMVSEIKTYKILTGVRGEKACDIESIVTTILKLGQLALDYPELKEMDINPAFVTSKGLMVVDMRMLV
ncbi:MAG: Acetyl coenzyme A synthetase (ADP forming), alpha domain protein [Parcubacteria group bacterium GW2011_GWC2_39_14]|nr:MAG: Acetyl coenzyme A synthetase (ADP forming), alpha domain protein [Parcubacteria group bacterium GW2011_GWC2_39_14]KKR53362.1 MAG: Acetyl coenzyme A synthetase (ADP forming), alpha domain protein [Parcubacteria group bacterium GW2011_GWA2_40_23]